MFRCSSPLLLPPRATLCGALPVGGGSVTQAKLAVRRTADGQHYWRTMDDARAGGIQLGGGTAASRARSEWEYVGLYSVTICRCE